MTSRKKPPFVSKLLAGSSSDSDDDDGGNSSAAAAAAATTAAADTPAPAGGAAGGGADGGDDDTGFQTPLPKRTLDEARLSQLPDDAFHLMFRPSADGRPPAVPSAQVPAVAIPGLGLFLRGAPVEQPAGVVRFVCVSDTHGRHRALRRVPPGDVLLHAGDITNVGELDQLRDFSLWLRGLPHKHKVVIAGNHDVTLDRVHYSQEANRRRWHRNKPFDIDECRAALTDCTWLEDAATTVEGYTVYGSPWQPEFYDWAYNLSRGEECRRVWAKIPTSGEVDVLMTHGPPLGFGDTCSGGNRAGCVDLLHTIRGMGVAAPKVHVFGHIHEGYGAWTDGTTTFINASTATLRYRMDHLPVVFDLPVKPPPDGAGGDGGGGEATGAAPAVDADDTATQEAAATLPKASAQ